ncbi:pilus assembly protein PilA [Mesorhizobium sp. Root552]|jgi:pilus assembly protein Flp/PilA|uniref:Flp family type IVb pilin n=1 Tax=Mesorhizobium sp. Root552 TaxID=1736555 RepID=UPI0006FD8610|nr:Flp family type IVb pilin [Mesorhizobium sp. Root552]KQZ33359.1 pilus assembly protein PilA [Mesorhizobium sp. Root552]
MARILQRFLNDETGATAIEYGLIVAVLSLAIIAGVGDAADALTELWNGNNSKLAEAFR